MTERAVGDDGDAVLPTPGEHGVFYGALLQMVENLLQATSPAPTSSNAPAFM